MSHIIKAKDLEDIVTDQKTADAVKRDFTQEGALKEVALYLAKDDIIDTIFRLADDDIKFIEFKGGDKSLRLRLLTSGEYSSALILTDTYMDSYYKNVKQDAYNAVKEQTYLFLLLMMSSCDKPCSISETVEQINAKAKIKFGTLLKTNPTVLRFLFNALTSLEKKLNPNFNEIPHDVLDEYIDAIKKKQQPLLELSYDTTLTLLDYVIGRLSAMEEYYSSSASSLQESNSVLKQSEMTE